MDFGSINWLAVMVCVVVSMISGTIWYNPKTFFPVWWKGIGKSDSSAPGAIRWYGFDLGIDHPVILRAGSVHGVGGQRLG